MDPHDRKVRAIYDALRAKNWKGAMKLANAALHKYKDSAVIQSFKAVALEKLGKAEEAFQICEKIRKAGTVDEQVLHTMEAIYKAMDRMDCLTEAYAAAVKLKKNDLDLMTGLFGCYVREAAFAKQQQLAMTMYRTASQSEKYLWWMVVSLVLQVWKRPGAGESVPPLGVEQTLKLAQSFIEKQLATKKTLHSLEALMLYIDLLYHQGDGEKVLEVLEGEMSAKLCKQQRELLVMKAQCHLQRKDFARGASTLREILSEEPEHWRCFSLLMDLYLPDASRQKTWHSLCSETCQLTQNLHGVMYTEELAVDLEKAEELLEDLQKWQKEKGQHGTLSVSAVRSAALMELDVAYRKLNNGLCTDEVFREATLETFRKLGHLKSTLTDLKPYILRFSSAEQEAFFVALQSELETRLTGDGEKPRDLCSSLANGYRILSLLNGSSLSVEATCRLMRRCLELCGNDPSDGTPDYEETAILAAVQFLMTHNMDPTAFVKMGIPVWRAFVILGLACDSDPSNPHLNIAFAAAAFLLGAPRLGIDVSERLEIKNLQLDSIISHLEFPFIQSYRMEAEARKWATASWQLFTSQTLDVDETTFVAYSEGTYTKIPEFVSFKARLDKSHAFYLTQCESSIHGIDEISKNSAPIDVFLKRICEDRPLEKATTDFFETYSLARGLGMGHLVYRLCFNEDLTVRPSWLPPCCGDYRFAVPEWWHSNIEERLSWSQGEAEQSEKWKAARISWLKIRWCIPHLLRRMCLLDIQDETRPAVGVLLVQNSVEEATALEDLRGKLEEWSGRTDKLTAVHSIYSCFQCSVFFSGHCAHDVYRPGAGTEAVEQWRKCLKVVGSFAEQILSLGKCGPLMRHVGRVVASGDISCWVQTASVTLGAMLYEELHFLTLALPFWKRKLASMSKDCQRAAESVILQFTVQLQLLLQQILHYLGLVNEMDELKIVDNILFLLGAMGHRPGQVTAEQVIQEQEMASLAHYMENLDLSDYDKSAVWDFYPGAETKRVEELLAVVLQENKKWALQLKDLAEKLLQSVST